MTLNRRSFLAFVGITTGVTALGMFPRDGFAQSGATIPEEPFKLPALPYDYDALEPYIDQETMRFHHDKHHAGYTRNLNLAVRQIPDFKNQTAEELLQNLEGLPKEVQNTVRNNGGGYVNHKMFWEIMSPKGGGKPQGELAKAINQKFGSFEEFQAQFNQAGSQRFGSGWAWLVLDKDGELMVMSTGNQDSPIMMGFAPIMGNDVWEHAYYLKYRNKRGEYLKQWWNVVNWKEVNRRYLQAKS
jgi:Fe-Mn family superoxide dismutase